MSSNDFILLLDEVLIIIKSGGKDNGDILTSLKEKEILIPSDDDLWRVTSKLSRDKYINLASDFDITCEGFLFSEQGGYNGQIDRSKSDSNRRKMLDNQLSLLTFFLAVGTMALAISEVIKLYFYFDERKFPRLILLPSFGLFLLIFILFSWSKYRKIVKLLKS